MVNKAKQEIQKILSPLGIKINGTNVWDIHVYDERCYERWLSEGSLGVGESYMEEWWDCKRLDVLFTKILKVQLDRQFVTKSMLFAVLQAKLFNMQSRSKSQKVAKEHYDVGNDMYEKMLGKTMQYTCAYWDNAKTLGEAQTAKLELVAKKLKLKPGEKVLELGGGWGGLAQHLAKNYKVHVTSYNISKEQVEYARKRCKGLPVTIKHEDYRNAKGTFDKVVSVGMMEHVGPKNFAGLMKLVDGCLKEEGLFLLHTIGGRRSTMVTDPWIEKYIFPGGVLPSVKQIAKAAEPYFAIEDYHNIGVSYDPTLMAWFENFDKHWPEYQDQYGERFYRMWKYYLLICAASFRSRKNQLFQFVFSKGIEGGYTSVR